MKVLKQLAKAEDTFMVLMLAVMCIVTAIQVFMRFVLNYPLVWSEELARYIFVWIAFIGAGYGVRHHLHIQMELFYKLLPSVLQKIISFITNLLSILCFAGLCFYGAQFTASQNSIASSAMGIPMSWVIVALPIGSALMVLYLCINTVRELQSPSMTEEGRTKC